MDLAGQLALLADRDDARAGGVGRGRREQEAAGLHAGDGVELALERVDQGMHHCMQRFPVSEYRSQVPEDDAGLRIIPDRLRKTVDQGFN